jgi:hypothetical protein
LVTFFLMQKVRVKQQLPSSKVEEFKVENRLKPSGLIMTVGKNDVRVWNFDEGLDKKKNTCKIESSV